MKFAVINEKMTPEPLLQNKHSSYSISGIKEIPKLPTNIQYSPNPALRSQLIGKQLLLDEISSPIEEIHEHYLNGYITYRKGVTIEKNNPFCHRCGNHDPSWFASFHCSRCDETCTYCRKCLMMGRVSTCTPLCSWKEPDRNTPTSHVPSALLSWSGTLSEGQQTASNQVVQTISNNKELLVWAVCGAGKTEVLFAGIDHALTHQKRVCIATPRTDVVLELTPRLQKVFPSIEVASLFGGSEDRHKHAPLTISTTHQLLRFYKAFDTVILDEVDAFPYSVDETLQFAVKNARKDVSSMIYLTATPNAKWQKECRLYKREFVTIPARYHRYPLPVPKFVWCGNWQKLLKKDKLPLNVTKWLQQRLESNKPAFLFIPKISLFSKILPIVKKLDPKIEGVHAEDPKRKDKVQAMRNHEIPLLVTTTILERGVTFPNLDVAVLGAEDQIFTESALVQISGRVGRSAQYPDGDITFFHYGKTEAMVRARNQILSMNKEAAGRGLLGEVRPDE
jgi:competence protein ComFA